MNLTAYQPPKAERRTDAPFTFPNQRPLPAADRPRVASLRCAGTYTPREPGRTSGRVEQPSCSGPTRVLQAARPRADIRGTYIKPLHLLIASLCCSSIAAVAGVFLARGLT